MIKYRDGDATDIKWKDGDKLKRFDFVVANPPFSVKNWTNGIDPTEDIFERFRGYGIPPEKNGDYAFLLHHRYLITLILHHWLH